MNLHAETGSGGNESGLQLAQPQVSVIVPCRNEGRNGSPCLQSILDNDYPPIAWRFSSSMA